MYLLSWILVALILFWHYKESKRKEEEEERRDKVDENLKLNVLLLMTRLEFLLENKRDVGKSVISNLDIRIKNAKTNEEYNKIKNDIEFWIAVSINIPAEETENKDLVFLTNFQRDVLELKENKASRSFIKQQYKLLAKKYHPDVCKNGEEQMKRINGVYDLLKN